jgi:hypothetical protein
MWPFRFLRAARRATAVSLGLSVTVSAQQVTLPTPRTAGPTPAIQQLLAYFSALSNWYKPTKGDDSLAHATLDYLRFRAILAPLDSESLPRIVKTPTIATVLSELFARDGAFVPSGFFADPPTVREQIRERTLLVLALRPKLLDDGHSWPEAVLRRIAGALTFVESTWADSEATAALRELTSANDMLTSARSATGSQQRTDRLVLARSHLAEATRLAAAADTNADAAAKDAATAHQITINLADGKLSLDAAFATLKNTAVGLPAPGATDQQIDDATTALAAARQTISAAKPSLQPGVGDATDKYIRDALASYSGSRFTTNLRNAQVLEAVIVTGSSLPRRKCWQHLGMFSCTGDSKATDPPSAVPSLELVTLTNVVKPGLTDQKLIGKLDTLARLAQLVAIERDIDGRSWFPLRDTEDARVFWRQQGASPLNLGYAGLSNTSASSMTEVASPLLHFIRLSLNITLATTSDTSAKKSTAAPPTTDQSPNTSALAQFLTGGGLFNIAAAIPLVSLQQRQAGASALLLLTPRAGGSIAAAGAVAKDPTMYTDTGVDLHLSWGDATEHVGFVGQLRYAVPTLSEAQATSMGVPKSFRYGTWSAGLLFADKYLFTVGRSAGGPSALNRVKAQIGVTVIGASK